MAHKEGKPAAGGDIFFSREDLKEFKAAEAAEKKTDYGEIKGKNATDGTSKRSLNPFGGLRDFWQGRQERRIELAQQSPLFPSYEHFIALDKTGEQCSDDGAKLMRDLAFNVVGFTQNQYYGFGDRTYERKPDHPTFSLSQILITPEQRLEHASLTIHPLCYCRWKKIAFSNIPDVLSRIRNAAESTVHTQLKPAIDRDVVNNASLQQAVNDLQTYYVGFNTLELLRCRNDQLASEATRDLKAIKMARLTVDLNGMEHSLNSQTSFDDAQKKLQSASAMRSLIKSILISPPKAASMVERWSSRKNEPEASFLLAYGKYGYISRLTK